VDELNSHSEEESSSFKTGGKVALLKHDMNQLNKKFIKTNKHLTRTIVKLDSLASNN